VSKAQKVERFGLPLSKPFTLLCRVAAKADQPGLVQVQRQFERAQSLEQVVQKGLCLMLMLEADHRVHGSFSQEAGVRLATVLTPSGLVACPLLPVPSQSHRRQSGLCPVKPKLRGTASNADRAAVVSRPPAMTEDKLPTSGTILGELRDAYALAKDIK
jgi:hypothetical protein